MGYWSVEFNIEGVSENEFVREVERMDFPMGYNNTREGDFGVIDMTIDMIEDGVIYAFFGFHEEDGFYDLLDWMQNDMRWDARAGVPRWV